MKRLLKYYCLPKNTEVLFMLTLGIVLQMTDGSPFTIKKRCEVVWDMELPPENFSQFVQHCIKMILSGIVIARCLTTYVYVTSAMLVMYSIIKDTTPRLMLLWLLIAAVKSIFLTFVEALTGVYVCSAFGKIRKVCVEFFLSKALEIIFAAYLWANVINIYREMEMKRAEDKKPKNWEEFYKQIDFKRPRTRSLLDESTLHKTARLNSFEFKDVPQIILQMLRREEEMSQDSLLGSGMMLASVSNFGSFDDLKTSQSLGELGLLDMKTVQVKGIEDDEYLSLQDKALRFLKLNWDDVRKAQESKKASEKNNYAVDSDIWTQVTASHANLKKPKQTRPEIVLKKISRLKFDDEKSDLKQKESMRKKSFELKFGFSLFSFLREKDELRRRDEEQLSTTYNLDEEEEELEEDGGSTSMFMSNIKEEVAVNRISLNFVSRKLKANAYSKLYKEEYMSVIGPEVFDTATRLPTVLPPMNYKIGTRASTSVPAFLESGSRSKKKINFDGDRMEGIQSVPSWFFMEHLQKKGSDPNCNDNQSLQESSYILAEEDLENAAETESTEVDENCDSNKIVKFDDFEGQNLEKISTGSSDVETNPIEESRKECSDEKNEIDEESSKNPPCFRKRKITVKIIGKRATKLANPNSGPMRPSKDGGKGGDDDFDESRRDFDRKIGFEDRKPFRENQNKNIPKEDPFKLNKIRDHVKGSNRKQVYLLMKLFQRPLIGGSATGYNLKTKNHLWQTLNDLLEVEEADLKNYFKSSKNLRRSRDSLGSLSDDPNDEKKQKKIWKSKVLETAATYNPEIENSSDPKGEYLSDVVMVVLKKKLLNGSRNRSSGEEEDLEDKENETGTDSFEADGFVICNRRKFDDFAVATRNSDFFGTTMSDANLESNYFRSDFPSNSNRNYSNVVDSIFSLHEMNRREPSGNSRIIRRCMNSAFFDKSIVNRHDGSMERNQLEKIKISAEEKEEEEFEDSPDPIIRETIWESLDPKPELETESEPEPKPGGTRKKVEFAIFSEGGNCNALEESQSCDRESEESFSLYYSKAADLASPLLDMKRFIYPDHIHYSYKHVKKKGFDVDINGKLPLLFRESLTMSNPISVKNVSGAQNPESRIVRRPMDLSFASSNAFAEWQNSYPGFPSENMQAVDEEEDTQEGQSLKDDKSIEPDGRRGKKGKKSKRKNRQENCHLKSAALKKSKSKSLAQNLDDVMQIYSAKDYFLIEKLLKIYRRLNLKREALKSEVETKSKRPPVQISSAQLHSNKGRINPICNPAVFLNENKTRNEKKKSETQEERTKDMFARLEREVLLQSKNRQKDQN